jgi:lipopolysaccharide biosynthesis glycosyltransferase
MKSLLVSLADENYIDQAKQLFSSVYFNAGWQGDYMLLAHEIPEEKLKWFRNKGILIKECKPLFEGKLESEHPTTVLCKFYIFTPEFKKWDNIVFLDADMIVRHSIQKLSKVKGFYATVDFNNSLLEKQFHKNIPNNLLFNKLSKNFNLNKYAFNLM